MKLIGAIERVLNGALFELGKGCTRSFAPSLPLGSNEAGKIGSSRGLTRRELQKSPGDRQQRPGFLMPGLQLLEAGTKGLRMGFFQIGQSALQIAEPGLPRIELLLETLL